VQRHFVLAGGTIATAVCVDLGAVQVQRQGFVTVLPAQEEQGLFVLFAGLQEKLYAPVLSCMETLLTAELPLLQLAPSLTANVAVSPHLTVSQTALPYDQPFCCGVSGWGSCLRGSA